MRTTKFSRQEKEQEEQKSMKIENILFTLFLRNNFKITIFKFTGTYSENENQTEETNAVNADELADTFGILISSPENGTYNLGI